LQARLVEEDVLPADVLTRTIRAGVPSDAELRAMIADLPVRPLHQYSDMELTDRFSETIPIVEICCAGPRVVPLLEEAHALADGNRKLLLAQMLALVGSQKGVPTLVAAITAQLEGDALPVRKADIRYTQLPPDHGAMPEVVHLLYCLGMTPDERAWPVWKQIGARLADLRVEDFYDDRKGVFYYVDALGYGAERDGSAALIPALEAAHRSAPLYGRTTNEGFEPDFVPERMAYLELVLGRALARCGSITGYLVLLAYLTDNRALLAEHAHSELVSITGIDYGKDLHEWGRWLEANGDYLPSRPLGALTEAMQAWTASEPNP
jgi:hypothetical protein